MKFSRGTLENAGTASLVTRITNDVNQVQNGMNMFLRLFLRSPFIVFGAMIMSFTVDVKAALAFCVVIPVLGLVVYLVMRATLPKFRKIQEGLEKVLLTVNENLEGVRVIRAFRVEKKQDKRFKDETVLTVNFACMFALPVLISVMAYRLPALVARPVLMPVMM